MADETREVLVPPGMEDSPLAVIHKQFMNPDLTGVRYTAYTTSGVALSAETALSDSQESRESALLAVCLAVIEQGYVPALPLPGEYWTYDNVRVVNGTPQGGN